MKIIKLRTVEKGLIARIEATRAESRKMRPLTKEHRTALKFRGMDCDRAFDNALKMARDLVRAEFDSHC